MATISYRLMSSTSDIVSIYMRVSINRDINFRCKSGYSIIPKDWSEITNMPKQGDENNKKLKNDLDELKIHIQKKCNEAVANKTEITRIWVQEQIDRYQNKKPMDEIEREYLINYTEEFIKELPKKVRNSKRGVSSKTKRKYSALKQKLIDFEAYSKKKYRVKDVDKKFRTNFVEYLTDQDRLSENTTGKYITNLKTICLDAKENDIETHKELKDVIGFKEDAEIIYLTTDEIEAIKDKKFEREALENARDWLVIGCYIGQRVSDLLKLTKRNITVFRGRKVINLTQQKMDEKVTIPVHPIVQEILDKGKGQFPKRISQQKFNEHIKIVAQLSKINTPTEGKKLDKKTKRKVKGIYQKWELVTSHICRRSFASNFYGKYPTALLIKITGHSTEKQFLEYIGKSSMDFATMLTEFWQKESEYAKKEPKLDVIRQAN